MLLLDLLHRTDSIPAKYRDRAQRLIELGVIKTVGRGRGTRYLLSRRFYTAMGRPGVYTRRRGLDREEHKALLLKHLRGVGKSGSPISELQQVLPSVSRSHLKRLLDEMRSEGAVTLRGERRWARWVAVDSSAP